MTVTAPAISDAAHATPPLLSVREALVQLSGRIDRSPISLAYRLGLLLVSAVMILLPLIYAALIALVGYCIYLHATYNGEIFRGSYAGGRASWIVYYGPLVIGLILIVFMIKPLFARRRKSANKYTLNRGDEPLLFEFVDRLCDSIGAPRPCAITVDCQANASASFTGGLGNFVAGRLVLTIGLPLVAGLDLRQFAGVLAHEFGHFAQGTGMRVSLVIRRVNLWFARVVYARDSWDEELDDVTRASGGTAIALVMWGARAMIWLTRRVLWALMMIGHGASCLLLRQMEFDADGYATRVAGSEAFGQTYRILPRLSVASDGAMTDLAGAWERRALFDDLPALVMRHVRRMPKRVRDQIAAAVAQKSTGWFDTHPAERDRVARATREGRAGVVLARGEATALFADFGRLCRETSEWYYRHMLGGALETARMTRTADLDRSDAAYDDAARALGRVFQNRLTAKRPLFPILTVPGESAGEEALVGRLIQSRARMVDLPANMGDAAAQFHLADDAISLARDAGTLLGAGFKKIDPAEFGLAEGNAEGVKRTMDGARTRRDQAEGAFAELEAVTAERFRAAVELAHLPKFSGAVGAGDVAGIRSILTTLESLKGAYPAIVVLGEQYARLAALTGSLARNPGDQELAARVRTTCATLPDQFREISLSLGSSAYPFGSADAAVPLAFVVQQIPSTTTSVAMLLACEGLLDRAFGCYFQAMGRLAVMVEQVEAALGMPPGSDPPEVT